MSFGESIAACFSKYATFSGRASRSEYWWFYLFTFLCQIGFQILGAIAGGIEGGDILAGLAALALVIPIYAVGARRMHDIGKSGWNQLWIITIIGIIPVIIWLARKGSDDVNQYGDPQA